ncbi:MAG: hypothetical protein ACYTGC_19505 [Planctomycetota bacterium]|jgi:hypothetical protein
MIRRTAFGIVTVVAMALSYAAVAGGTHAQTLSYKAQLFGDKDVRGHAVFVVRTNDDDVQTVFKVRIKNAEPGQEFNVFIDDTFIDTMTAGENGRGQLRLVNPSGFPELTTATTITVGNLSGAFFDRAADADVQRYRISQPYACDNVTGRVKYLERYKNGRLMRSLVVRVDASQPGDLLDVYVNEDLVGGLFVVEAAQGGASGDDGDDDDSDDGLDSETVDGPVTMCFDGQTVLVAPDAVDIMLAFGATFGVCGGEGSMNGRGTLKMRTRAFIPEDNTTIIPIPRWVPTLLPGDTLMVGDCEIVIE